MVLLRVAWAAGLWTCAFDVKKAGLVGADPATALTKAEAEVRCRLAVAAHEVGDV
jgi:hypothetical protein